VELSWQRVDFDDMRRGKTESRRLGGDFKLHPANEALGRGELVVRAIWVPGKVRSFMSPWFWEGVKPVDTLGLGRGCHLPATTPGSETSFRVGAEVRL